MSSWLDKGVRVTLHSLKTTEMNNKNGTVMKWVKEEGRWAIKIDDYPTKTSWKKIKPQNLKRQDTIGVVVIPPDKDMYYQRLPITTLKDHTHAESALLEGTCGGHYYHYFYLPNGDIGWMSMAYNDLFINTKINDNLSKLGWNAPDNRSTYMEGTVVVSFHTDGTQPNMKFYEPYDMDTVKMLVKELAEARTDDHPRRERMMAGMYTSLPLRPCVPCVNEDEDYS